MKSFSSVSRRRSQLIFILLISLLLILPTEPYFCLRSKFFRSFTDLHDTKPPSPTTSPPSNTNPTTITTTPSSPTPSLPTTNTNNKNKNNGNKNPLNPEEKIKLEISIESKSFLKNIIEYGKNRMARRAVGILQKMPAYKINPTELHYTHALWACENSQQYGLGLSVFEEMISKDIPRSVHTYEALISLAEKTDHLQEALQFFQQMKDQDHFIGTTNIYNSCLIVLEKLKNLRKANEIYEEMDKNQIEKDIVTYTAMIAVCEQVGNAERAIEIFEQLEEDIDQQRQSELSNLTMDPLEATPPPTVIDKGFLTSSNPTQTNLTVKQRKFLGITTETVNLLLWACVKGHEPKQAIKLFHIFSDKKAYPYVNPDVNTYNAMIWANEMTNEPIKAEGYLTVMKMNHIKPQTMTYDGVISAYAKQNQYEPILNLLKCMTNECIPKSPISYQLAIDCLDRQSNENLEILQKTKKLKGAHSTSSNLPESAATGGSSIPNSNGGSPPANSKYSNNHYYFNYINELYFSALRDGFFNPWVKGTRQLDLRGFLLSICKVAVKTILLSMLEKKLSVFTLEMIVAEERPLSSTSTESTLPKQIEQLSLGMDGQTQDLNKKKELKEIISSFDIDIFYDYLSTLHLYSWGENSVSPKQELRIQTIQEGNLIKYVISRESILQWLELQQ